MNAKPARYSIAFSIAVVAIGIPLLFIPLNSPYESRSLKEIWNFGHVLLFACATILVSANWQWFRNRAFEIQIAILIAAVLVVGMAIEVIQLHTGGDFSIGDVLLDIAGACLVPAIKPRYSNSLMKYSPWIIRLALLSYLLVRAYPVGISLVDEYQARRQFPVLAGFESTLELGRFGGGSRLRLMDGGMEVRFTTDKYSGFSLKYFPRDWRGFHNLNIEIRNPDHSDVRLTCRIHDQHHDQSYNDRYNRRFRILPGMQTIKIDLDKVRSAPRTRTMDMGKIGGFGCFTVRLPAPRVLIIRKIALSRRVD